MLGLNYSIQYKKGQENKAADAPSKRDEPEEEETYAITIVQPQWVDQLVESYIGDTEAQQIIIATLSKAQRDNNFSYQ